MAKHICTLKSDHSHFRMRRTTMDKFLGYFEDLILVSEKNPRTMLHFRSYSEIQTERVRQRMYSRRVIHPYSEFRVYFELLMLCVFLAHLIATPWDMFCDALFAVHLGPGVKFYLFMSFIFGVVDIYITFYTGYLDTYAREIVIDLKKIRRHYFRGWLFTADLIATLPLELVIDLIPNTHVHHIRWIQLICITRLCRLPTTIIYMNNAADLWQVSLTVYRSIRYMIFAILILHWTACLTAIISKYFFIYNVARTQQNWIRSAGIRVHVGNIFDSYVTAVFRTAGQLLGVSHGIYPNLTVEDKVMTVIVFICGYFLMAFVLITTLEIIMTHAVPHLTNLAFLNQLQIYMTRIKLAPDKQKKLVDYCNYKFREMSLYDQDSLKLLSEQLRNETVLYTYRSLIKNVSIIAEFPKESIDMMINYLKREIFLPGDYIMKAGTPGNCMYFIVNGTVAITTMYDIEICHLHDGSYFGEIALLLENNKRTSNAIALEISEICKLDRKHFKNCISSDSEHYKRLYQEAVIRLKYMEKLNDIHISRVMKKNMVKLL